MNRRRFLKLSSGALMAAGSFSPRVSLAAQPPDQATRDRFGGYRPLRFEASGYFRLQKADRWWLVTPEGNAFLSFGVNHVEPGLLQQAENREHWRKALGLGPRPKRDDWLPGFRAKVRSDMAAFGFNTLGCHSSASYFQDAPLPYVQSLPLVAIAHSRAMPAENFVDVFSKKFEEHCERITREKVAPRRNDPYLIGYSLCDCPILTEAESAARDVQIFGAPRDATSTWPRALRNLGGDAPGKSVYVELLRRIYSDRIEEFNRTYRTFFDSFEAMRQAKDWRPAADPGNFNEVRDNQLFLQRIIDRYYSVATASIRRQDPNHLLLGDKINGNTNPPDFVIEQVGRHMDMVFYQCYGYYSEQRDALDRWSRLTGKPLFNGDSSFSVPSEQMPYPLGPHCRDQQDRARWSIDFAEQAFARPDFVGWNHCGWMDGWKSIPGKEVRQHSGLQDPFGTLHAPMVTAFAEFSRKMYSIALRFKDVVSFIPSPFGRGLG